MGLVKTRRLAAMQKQQRTKFGKPPSVKKDILRSFPPRLGKSKGRGSKTVFGLMAYSGLMMDHHPMVTYD